MIVPRDYQLQGIAQARAAIGRGVRRLLLVLATGGGKTVVAAQVALGAVGKGKRVLFLAHRREIVLQARAKLIEAGLPGTEVGAIMASAAKELRRPNASVQVASVQTLANRARPPADVLFVDEAHHARAATWQTLVEHYRAAGAVVVGLTATPVRADGRGLGDLFDEMLVVRSFAELAADGFLVTPRAFTTPTGGPDLSGVKTTGGDYNLGQLEAAVNKRELVGDLVEHWQRLAEGRTTAVFAAGVEHSKAITAAFVAAGVRAEHLDANTPVEEREAILARMASGETRVVSNMGVLTEGWDLPRCKCIVLARPTKSLALYLQMAGRGLRPWEGQSALLVDHAGCVHEHGFPQDAREWSLEGRKAREKSAPSVRTCPKCYAALPGATKVCPECGFVFPVAERSGLQQVDGHLVELTPEERAKAREERERDELRRKVAGAVWRHARAAAAYYGGDAQEHARGLNRELARRYGRRPTLDAAALRRVLEDLDHRVLPARAPEPVPAPEPRPAPPARAIPFELPAPDPMPVAAGAEELVSWSL